MANLEEVNNFVKQAVSQQIVPAYKEKFTDRELILMSCLHTEFVIRMKKEGAIVDVSEFNNIFRIVIDQLKSYNDNIKK